MSLSGLSAYYAADAYSQANPTPAQGLPHRHSILHTSHLAFHIFTAGTLVVAVGRGQVIRAQCWTRSNHSASYPPPSGGWQIYSAWCLGVTFCFSYSLPFVTLSLCDGDEASPAVLSVEPALCCSTLHPPSPGRWQPCSARGTGFASPLQCRSTLNLEADSLLRYGFACDIQYYINRAWGCFSLISGLMRVAPWWGETKPSALSVVPAWAVQHCIPSRGGWQAFAVFDAWVSPPSSCWLPLCYPESASSCALHSWRRSPFSTFLSPRYQASHLPGVRMRHPHHRQHTRQVTDIRGRPCKCASQYNNNTRPASNQNVPWAISDAQFFEASHTQTKASQPVHVRSEC